MEFVGVRVGSKDPRSLILELRLSEWLTVQVDSLGGGWKSETARVAIYGPPLFGLPPNGLFMFGLSLIGLQGQLDYTQLDYL